MVVKKTQILLAAGIFYLGILIVGGSIYMAYRLRPHPEPPEPATLKVAAASTTAEQAREQKEAVAAEEAKRREKRIDQLKASMDCETVHGITYYRYDWAPRMPSGVYLRPVIAMGNGRCILKTDVRYSYTIDDPQQTAWIFGDRLDIVTSQARTTLAFNPTRRHKQMASNAEWLMEAYVTEAIPAAITALRQVVAAGHGQIVYYQQGGKSRLQELSTGEIERIRNVLELYDLMTIDDA